MTPAGPPGPNRGQTGQPDARLELPCSTIPDSVKIHAIECEVAIVISTVTRKSCVSRANILKWVMKSFRLVVSCRDSGHHIVATPSGSRPICRVQVASVVVDPGRDLVDDMPTDIAQKCRLRTRSCMMQQLLH
jgi:hypothetical protein